MNINKDSKYLSYLLRHHPEKANLNMDNSGWVEIHELIKNTSFTKEYLEEIVNTDKKRRYSFSQDKKYIRANQGHSIPVNLGLTPQAPPEILYHGTAKRFKSQIIKDGIKKMSREYVHLSSNYETAVKVGSRHGEPVVLIIDTKKMNEDGVEFFLSENKVWLTNYVAPKYIKNIMEGE